MDKILQRGKERGWPEFWEDMEALNVGRPVVVKRVTEHVDCSIVPHIQMIVDNGTAYLVEEEDTDGANNSGRGSVYFDVVVIEATPFTFSSLPKRQSTTIG